VRNEVEIGGGSYSTEQTVRDGRIVTAQTWQSHPEFYREIFRCLGTA
jgi:protease I